MIVNCAYCGKEVDLQPSHVNRSRKNGNDLYCNKVCSGLGRRKNLTDKEKKKNKRDYDKKYRKKNRKLLKKKKADYFQRTYDPQKAAVERKKNMHRHVEYCRQPEYKKKKKAYDQKYTAKKNYGEFAEAAIILHQLEKEVDKTQANQLNGIINKSQTRKRKWQQNQKAQP